MIEKNFGWALELVKNGKRLFRQGWNGRSQFIALHTPNVDSKMTLPYLYIKTAHDEIVPWLASQVDLLSIDWEILE
ncbi:MAG: hypothetical protein NVSMB70_12610 [Chamaesiphon sp.]